MVCQRCSSEKQNKFKAEINLHFPGWEGLEKPTVLIFPDVIVCQNCGYANFDVPEGELRTLAEGAEEEHLEPI